MDRHTFLYTAARALSHVQKERLQTEINIKIFKERKYEQWRQPTHPNTNSHACIFRHSYSYPQKLIPSYPRLRTYAFPESIFHFHIDTV